ncbi:MAG: hypothetical protein H6581_23715 [Bacteroidia bacterium]|nr:hypothetical protein [Bacteroidia bacterium]
MKNPAFILIKRATFALLLLLFFGGCRDSVTQIIHSLFGEIVEPNPRDGSPPEVRITFAFGGRTITVTPQSEVKEFQLNSLDDFFYLLMQGEDPQGVREIRYWTNYCGSCTYSNDLQSNFGPSLGVTQYLTNDTERATTRLSHFERVHLAAPCKEQNSLTGYLVYKDFSVVAENFGGQTSEVLTVRFYFSSP